MAAPPHLLSAGRREPEEQKGKGREELLQEKGGDPGALRERRPHGQAEQSTRAGSRQVSRRETQPGELVLTGL